MGRRKRFSWLTDFVLRPLMDVLEDFAREQAVSTLSVPSSITAEGFYRKRGFAFIRDEFHGDERTIIMKKRYRARVMPRL